MLCVLSVSHVVLWNSSSMKTRFMICGVLKISTPRTWRHFMFIVQFTDFFFFRRLSLPLAKSLSRRNSNFVPGIYFSLFLSEANNFVWGNSKILSCPCYFSFFFLLSILFEKSEYHQYYILFETILIINMFKLLSVLIKKLLYCYYITNQTILNYVKM